MFILFYSYYISGHDLLNDNNPVTIPKEQNNYSFGQIHSGTEENIQTKNLLFRKLPSLKEAAYYIAMANENKVIQ